MSVLLPKAAAIIITGTDYDPVTDTREPAEPVSYFASNPFISEDEDGLLWLTLPSIEETRVFEVKDVSRVGGKVTAIIPAGEASATVEVRPVTATDAALLSSLSIAQPVDVVEAHVNREGDPMLAGELDAAVAPDNSVVTLVLDTGIGLYVRFSGDWQLLPETSTTLDNLSISPVDPKALEVFDAADAAGKTVDIFDLPRTINNVYTDVTDREGEEETPAAPVTASLPDWYLAKRSREVREDPSVIVAAGEYVEALESGTNPDPMGVFIRDLIRRARAANLLNHPAVVAAVNWRAWLHPRGRDGRFIHKQGIVNVFDSPDPSPGEPKRRAKVRDLTQRGVVVDYIDPITGKPTGESATLPSNLIEDHRSLASLNPDAPSGGMADEVETPASGPIEKLRGAYEGIAAEVSELLSQFPSANTPSDAKATDEELAAHVQLIDGVNDIINTRKLDVASVMKDETGRWDDEFYEWMLDTADEVFEAKFADKPKDRKALITGGLGGAGKSTTLARLAAAGILNPDEWATINPDEMKEEMIARGMFPEVEGLSPSELANALHEASSEISALIQQRALSEGTNVIFDITMGGGLKKRPDGRWGGKGHLVADELKEAGYGSIDGVFVDIPVEQSVKQALGRHRGGVDRLRAGQSAEGGRYVPPAVIQSNSYNPLDSSLKDRRPNLLGFGVGKNDVYEDRYGPEENQQALAAQAEALRAAIFSSTPENADDVDGMLADFTAAASGSGIDRANLELGALEEEWAFMDPRVTGVNAADRFKSINAYNFAKATWGDDPAIDGDYVAFDNSDLNNPQVLTATGKFDGAEIPTERPPRVNRADEVVALLPETVDTEETERVSNILSGLQTGSHELLASPTSEKDGRYRLHVGLVHGDESENEAWIEFDSAENRDAALEVARVIQDAGFEGRAKKVSAVSETPPEVQELANGLVDPGPTDTKAQKLRSRTKMASRLVPTKNADGSWSLVDSTTGNIVGVSGDRETIATQRTQILNHLYPPI